MRIQFLYTLFLGILIALFIGFGFAAFYQSPKMPEYPTILSIKAGNDGVETAEQKAAQVQYDTDLKAYNKSFQRYNKYISAGIIAVAILVMAISLVFLSKILLLSDGLLLGGIFSLLYGMMRGFMTDDPRYSFIIISIGLVVAFILGYIKFIKPEKSKR